MGNINNQNVNNNPANMRYSIGYQKGRRQLGYAGPKRNANAKNDIQDKSLIQRLDAIDKNYEYKPILYEIFNKMDANSITPTIQ